MLTSLPTAMSPKPWFSGLFAAHRFIPCALIPVALSLTMGLAGSLGCSQDSGATGVDASGQQDTVGVIDAAQSDAASKDGTAAEVSATDAVQTDAIQTDVTTSQLRWFTTCGDPVCKAWRAKAGVALCSTEQIGDPCSPAALRCDPKNACNSLLVCTDNDPKTQPGGCPISARRFKTAIHYLDESAEAGLRDELLRLPLATWRYRHAARPRRRLGYILEDAPRLPASDMGRERVDLYALSTMAVAAIKAQQRELRVLREEIAKLRTDCRRTDK